MEYVGRMNQGTKLCIYSIRNRSDFPLAIARYTLYDEQGTAVEVTEMKYWNEMTFTTQLRTAVEQGFDISVITKLSTEFMTGCVKEWVE